MAPTPLIKHMRVYLLAMAAVLFLPATGLGQTNAPAPKPPAHSRKLSVYGLAEGTWDWAHGDSTCLGNRHTISFSPDHKDMLITFEQPADTASSQRVFRYRITAAGDGVLPDLPFVIRAKMEGEDRKTDSGETVVWDMIMASPNRYHWHRMDWPGVGVTGAVIRCDGTQPLEHWEPRAPQPTTPQS